MILAGEGWILILERPDGRHSGAWVRTFITATLVIPAPPVLQFGNTSWSNATYKCAYQQDDNAITTENLLHMRDRRANFHARTRNVERQAMFKRIEHNKFHRQAPLVSYSPHHSPTDAQYNWQRRQDADSEWNADDLCRPKLKIRLVRCTPVEGKAH